MRRSLPLLLIFIITFILYYPIFGVYFSQDDFFHFKVSQTDGSLAGFLNLLGLHPFEERGIAFYRPIFREALFNTFYNLFGLNHLPFRILAFGIHLTNIYLVYVFIQKLFQKKQISFFVSFFFGISSAHVATLYYLAGGIQALGTTMFIISTLICFIKFLETQKFKFLIFGFLTFLFALGSHELAVITPVLLGGLVFVYLPSRSVLPNILRLLPFLLIAAIYVYLEITVIGFSSKELQYTPTFNLKTALNSLAWYTGWAFGLPEMLIDFVLPGLNLNPTLMRYWGTYYIIIFATFAIAVTTLATMTIYIFLRKKVLFYDKRLWFLILWFPLGILPVLLLPLHKSTYYLAPVLPASWGFLGFFMFNFYWNFKKRYPKTALWLVIILCITLITLSSASIKLGDTTFWAAQRGRLAQKLINQVKSQYPTLSKGAVIYIENDPNYPFVAKQWGGSSKQAYFILNGNDALQLLYKDPTLKAFYEDLGGVPKSFPKEKVFQIIAKLY